MSVSITSSVHPSERERTILKMVIEDYIETAHPVPSARLKQKFRIAWSPATIRSVLHTLDEVGLLDHVHVSSGKIPTDSGYRFYVEELMDKISESEIVKAQIVSELSAVAQNVDMILQITADTLARLSQLFGFAFLDLGSSTALTDLELIPMSSGRLLLVLGFESQHVKTAVLTISARVKESQLETITSVLRERLLGLSIGKIQSSIGDRLKNDEVYSSDLVQVIVKNARSYFAPSESPRILISQKDYLLQNPEFSDTDTVQSIVSVLDDSATLMKSISEVLPDVDQTTLSIGKENPESALRHCSVVTRRFELGSVTGHLGVIGPTRMSYRDIYALVSTLSRTIPSLVDD
ncbi:MAG: heat-inducible transcriptional repressor HrcA [Fidelibacterota bacterium]